MNTEKTSYKGGRHDIKFIDFGDASARHGNNKIQSKGIGFDRRTERMFALLNDASKKMA